MKKIYALLTSALIATGLRAAAAPAISKETKLQPNKPSSVDTVVKPTVTNAARKAGEGQKDFLKVTMKEAPVLSKDQKTAVDSKMTTNIKLAKDSKMAVDSKNAKTIKLATDQKISKDSKMAVDAKSAKTIKLATDQKLHKDAGKIEQIKKAEIKK